MIPHKIPLISPKIARKHLPKSFTAQDYDLAAAEQFLDPNADDELSEAEDMDLATKYDVAAGGAGSGRVRGSTAAGAIDASSDGHHMLPGRGCGTHVLEGDKGKRLNFYAVSSSRRNDYAVEIG